MSLITGYEIGMFFIGTCFGLIIGVQWTVNYVLSQRDKEERK